MSHIIADNIISPLGDTSLANYTAVKAGKTALAAHSCAEIGIKEDFVASLLSAQQRAAISVAGLSHFEAKVVASVTKAVEATTIDLTDPRVVLILSTTKGNIEQIATPSGNVHIGESAARIAAHLGMKSTPIVVCNACISGLSAIILADRLLSQGQYDYAVVCGTDDIGRFVVSGFQSLKALSPQQCRPFDMERMGLNLGEAVATMVLSSASAAGWHVCGGAVRNDAFHISAPSKKAEGQYLCLEHIMQHVAAKDLAFVNLHGTATLFNDQMESVAVERASLSNVPANSLKGYFGHTLGAAGILETIISIKAADDHTVLATRGFEELGVSGKVNLSASNTSTDKSAFVKTLSGFGGCNAATLIAKGNTTSRTNLQPKQLKATHRVTITPSAVATDDTPLPTGDATPAQLLTWLYKHHIGNYPKYYKMDKLCRLGFIASELLLQAEGAERFVERDDRAVVFFNSLSSLNADKAYFESIAHHDDFFPSPSLFVYTLPNIVTGEIAIRNLLHGETAFYVIPRRDEALMHQVMQATAADTTTRSIVGGWLEYADDQNFTADLSIFEIQ